MLDLVKFFQHYWFGKMNQKYWIRRVGTSVMKPASLLLLAILIVSALGPILHPTPSSHAIRMGNGTTTGDLVLYRNIDEAVRHGEDYYHAAARLQREGNYPLKPFLTVRPPSLTWLYALVGPTGMVVLAIALICLDAAIWYRNMFAFGFAVRVATVALVATLGAAGMDARILCSHEWWCGLLLTGAIGLSRRGDFAARLALATAATLIRELAAPFLVLMLGWELYQRRWSKAAAAFGVLVAMTVLLLLHRHAVDLVALPTDHVSAGWAGQRGIYGFTDDIALLTGFDRLWKPLAIFLALVPFVGWWRYSGARDFLAVVWFLAFAVLVAIAARADNFYWTQVIFPSYFIGWILVPGIFHSNDKSALSAASKGVVG